MADAERVEIAIKQVEFARRYMRGLIADVPDEDWFRMPEGITHIGWQVAHLAMAQYGLCLFRLRGRRSEDMGLMSADFRKKYSKGSQPNADPDHNPPPREIRATLDRIHEQALTELRGYVDADLDMPVDEPHAVFTTKIGAVYFCSMHEMMHAGQIGLLRRMLGKNPLR